MTPSATLLNSPVSEEKSPVRYSVKSESDFGLGESEVAVG